MPDRRRTLTAGLAALALSGSMAGCDIARTGTVSANSPQVVTVLPLTYGQSTRLTWDQATLSALQGLGLTITPTGAAVANSLGGAGVDFPVTTGYVELHTLTSVLHYPGESSPGSAVPDLATKPGWVQGSLFHSGSGLTISTGASDGSSTTGGPTTGGSGSSSVTLTDFTADLGNSVLYATVDGKLPQVPLLTLDGSHVTATSDATGSVGGTFPEEQSDVTLQGTVAKLTPEAAQLLDTRFSTSAVTAGMPLGTVRVALTAGQPYMYRPADDHVTAFSRLTGQGTTVTLDPSTASALTGLGVTVTPTGSATGSASALTFPITGGMVAVHSDKGFRPGYVVGSVLHQGSGVSFTGPNGASVNAGDFVVDPGGSELYADVNGRRNVPFLFLDGSKLTVTSSGSTVTLDGTVAELTSNAADALNTTFGVQAFKAGMPLGTVHLVATGQPGS
ncbi:MAG TPA: hypothetical protein VFP61_12555 [Acidimicrobiales bacterium]|nr:hypothetical protein [Acidimicrobiales bacterium]